MLLNLLIVAFILFFAYWLGLEGFFSALLHLGLVIVSGALAFALWEPISVGLLAGFMPRFAWAVGLIMPFVIFLLVSRVLMDKFVSANVDFSQLTNLIAGGICGALAAALCAGIFVVGCLRLPSGIDFMGYKKFAVVPGTGEIVDDPQGEKLWIAVDDLAVNLFSKLSLGSFSPANDKPLALYQPALIDRAHWVRTRPDANTSVTATPKSVEVKDHIAHEVPLASLPDVFKNHLPARVKNQVEAAGHRIVLIDTQWKNEDKAYDLDPKLRVYPTQVQLVTFAPGPDAKPTVHHPFAFSTIADAKTKAREFTMAGSDAAVATMDGTTEASIGWLFVLPASEQEQFILIRNLRFMLKGAKKMPGDDAGKKQFTDNFLAMVGPTIYQPRDKSGKTKPPPQPGTKDGGGLTAGGVKAEDVKLTADLPRVTSRNLTGSVEITAKNEFRRGEIGVAPPGPISPQNRVERIHIASDDLAMLRVKLSRDQANSMFGQAIQSAAALNAIFVQDNAGEQFMPIGYVWLQGATGFQQINIEPANPIKSISQLPYKKMAGDDELYVYYLVKRGTRLMSIHVGASAKWDLNQLDVPKKE